MANHGINVAVNGTNVSTPSVAECGIPFIVGAAPMGAGTTATAGVPVLCTSWAEAVAAVGYSDDWNSYPVCEAMYAYFKVFACAPIIINPLAREATATNAAAALEAVELCLTKFGIIPDMILCPGLSDNASLATAMAAKAKSISGMFKAKAIVDIAGATYTAAVSAKNAGSFDASTLVCWPTCKIDTKTFHMSTIVAATISATDGSNGSIPYESPSNKVCHLTGLVDAEGNEINLTKAQADTLNGAGIVTAINFMSSFRLWGNYTAAQPTSTDVKDYFIPVARMFDWVSNTLIRTFWAHLDAPMTRRLLDTILDNANIWLDGLVGAGYLLGARVEMNADENTTASLMKGIVKLHVYLTPPSPAQEIDFVLEYDADYVSAALEA